MNKPRKILFLPSYDYLSFPLLSNISSAFKNYETFIFNFEEFSFLKNEKISNGFNYIFNLKFKKYNNYLCARIYSLFYKNILLKWYSIYYFYIIKPDVVISTTDCSIMYNACISLPFQEHCKYYVIQPSFFDAYFTTKPKCHKFLYFLYNKLISPKFNFSGCWGTNNKKTNILLWGTVFKKYFNTYQNTVHVVGNPNYDDFILLPNSKSYDVLICTEALNNIIPPSHVASLFAAYNELVLRLPHRKFLVKLHPRDDLKTIMNFFQITVPNLSFDTSSSFSSLIFKSKLQISVCSTTSLESVICGVPSILFNPSSNISLKSFFESDMLYKISNIEDLSRTVCHILDNLIGVSHSWRTNIINNYLGGSLNGSSQKIFKIIEGKL